MKRPRLTAEERAVLAVLDGQAAAPRDLEPSLLPALLLLTKIRDAFREFGKESE